MEQEVSRVAKARNCSGLSPLQAAASIGVNAVITYTNYEKNPETFTIEKLGRLYEAMNDEGKQHIREYVACFFEL
jgi:hypothetical protein